MDRISFTFSMSILGKATRSAVAGSASYEREGSIPLLGQQVLAGLCTPHYC